MPLLPSQILPEQPGLNRPRSPYIYARALILDVCCPNFEVGLSARPREVAPLIGDSRSIPSLTLDLTLGRPGEDALSPQMTAELLSLILGR